MSAQNFATMLRSPAIVQRPAWLPSLVFALGGSLGLFWLLYTIIHVSGHGVEKTETLPTIDFVRLRHDTEIQTLEHRKPPPPPPKQPPPPAKMHVVANAAAAAPGISVPTNVGLSMDVGSGIGGGAGVAGMLDSDLIPLQRIPPQYPSDARRAGITGWVKLDLTIGPDGGVRNAKVVEAKPKGLFEAAAVQAILKWRFKPKVVDGKPVTFHGIQKIDFTLSK
jgi:protein TonB